MNSRPRRVPQACGDGGPTPRAASRRPLPPLLLPSRRPPRIPQLSLPLPEPFPVLYCLRPRAVHGDRLRVLRGHVALDGVLCVSRQHETRHCCRHGVPRVVDNVVVV